MRPLIIAHRGASAVAPENTFAAFQRAIEDGAEGIEFDVRLTADGVPVVFHDETLQRIAGRNARILETQYAELANVDVGYWFNDRFPESANPAFSKQRIPTLQQTLNLLTTFRGRIYIELKCQGSDQRRLVEAVAKDLREFLLLDQVIVKSFRLAAIRQAREILPGLRTAALFEPTIMTMLRKKRYIIDLASDFEADELSLHYSLATRRLLGRAADRSMPVTVWTIDDPAWVKNRNEMGLAAIITNNPKLMLESLEN